MYHQLSPLYNTPRQRRIAARTRMEHRTHELSTGASYVVVGLLIVLIGLGGNIARSLGLY